MKKNAISPYAYPGIRQVDLLLSDFEHIEKVYRLTETDLFEIVAKANSLSIDEIMSSSRSRECVEARQVIFKAMREKLNYTLKKIGEKTGARHHTTIMHNLCVFDNDYRTSENFRERVNPIMEKLGLLD